MLPELGDLVVALVQRGQVQGEKYSVGRYTPAVADPRGYEWAVLNRQGSVLALSRDAFDAARHYLWLANGDIDESATIAYYPPPPPPPPR